MNLWTELNNLVKVPMCTCSGCRCGVSSQILAMYKEDNAQHVLMGLNDDLYSTLRNQILALDLLPTLDRIFNMTQQEESDKKVIIARDNRTESA